MLIGAVVVLPRSYAIAQAHSATYDEAYHLRRGLHFLTRSLGASDLELNDPPLGEGIVAIPLLISNVLDGRTVTDDRLYDRPGRAEMVAGRVALWNSSLFVGFLAIVFSWCRRLYDAGTAALATTLFAVEPNFAAHIPLATLDVLGVEGIVIAALLAWRYFEHPTIGRLLGVGFAVAAALLIKHTAVILPMVVLGFAGLHWVFLPWLKRQDASEWKRAVPGRLGSLGLLAIFVVIGLFSLSLFDFSPPMNRAAVERQSLGNNGAPISPSKERRVALERALKLDHNWPAGCYWRAFRTGMGHGVSGHRGYLNGEWREQGWWNYFPIVASYKVPLGVALFFGLAVVSLGFVRPRWAEWGLFLPMVAWTLFMLNSRVNLGFRHFLPAYAFMLMLGSRWLLDARVLMRSLGWVIAAAAALHPLVYHPDYLCYMNAPWKKPYLAISDCNVDWGQSLKEVRAWLGARPDDGRPVFLYYFGSEEGSENYYLSGRVTLLSKGSPRPDSGVLLISPVRVVEIFEDGQNYGALAQHEPDAVIGHSILVYDLDRLQIETGFRWPAPAPGPMAERKR
jgi:hypothetical protein